MRILQVHTRYRQAGGEDAVVKAEADLLRAAGHTVITHRAENPDNAVSAATAMLHAPLNRAAQRRVTEAVRQHRPDVAHVHNTWFAMSPSVVTGLHRAGVPVVMTLHNYRLVCANGLLFRDGSPCEDCVGTHPWRGVLHRCYRRSALASAVVATNISVHRARGTWQDDVDLYLALTGFARERFVAGGLPGERIAVKPNFVEDPGRRSAAPSSSDEVLYCGRLTAEKGISMLLDAWEAAGDTGLRLTIVGDGPLRPQLQARRLPRVTFTGFRPPEETRRRMLTARALAFPSLWYEGQPLVILEALAAGLPVLTADLGGMRDIAATLAGVWRLTPGDTDSWTAALQKLDDVTVNEGGSRARALYEERFTTTVALAALESAYESLRSRDRRGTG